MKPLRQERVRRIQVGLVGITAVLIALFVASAVLRSLRSELKPAGAQTTRINDKPTEPLAALGVAPGESLENKAAATPLSKTH